jgi:hypothetical protein
LAPLTARDASSDVGNLVTALNLTNPKVTIPPLPSPVAPPPKPCLPLAGGVTEFGRLAQSEVMNGWKVR